MHNFNCKHAQVDEIWSQYSEFQSKAQGVKIKNPLFQIFFISFPISSYKFIASENPTIFASIAHVRPITGERLFSKLKLFKRNYQ